MRRLLLFAVLLALASCTQADVPDHLKKPNLVSVGMSVSEVEALVGRSSQTCWGYEPDGFLELVCFRNEKAISYFRAKIGVPIFCSSQIEEWNATTSPPSYSAATTKVEAGMSPGQVAGLLGRHLGVKESYVAHYNDYEALFANGKLVRFEVVPRPAHP